MNRGGRHQAALLQQFGTKTAEKLEREEAVRKMAEAEGIGGGADQLSEMSDDERSQPTPERGD